MELQVAEWEDYFKVIMKVVSVLSWENGGLLPSLYTEHILHFLTAAHIQSLLFRHNQRQMHARDMLFITIQSGAQKGLDTKNLVQPAAL